MRFKNPILYVDDDIDDFNLLKDAISAIEPAQKMMSAKDGVHALELLHLMKLKNSLPVLIVLDINMPRLNGKETFIFIKNDALFSKIPIVLFSTSSSQLDTTFALIEHVELITKPYTSDNLHIVAAKLLSYCSNCLPIEM